MVDIKGEIIAIRDEVIVQVHEVNSKLAPCFEGSSMLGLAAEGDGHHVNDTIETLTDEFNSQLRVTEGQNAVIKIQLNTIIWSFTDSIHWLQ